MLQEGLDDLGLLRLLRPRPSGGKVDIARPKVADDESAFHESSDGVVHFEENDLQA